MKLASVERIISVDKHPNADSLDIVKVKNYSCIVKLGEYKPQDLIVFIQPDSVLPQKSWAEFYKAKSSRVKAIKLRKVYSFGIVESFKNVGIDQNGFKEGDDLTDLLEIIKYEPPAPQELNAKGFLPYGLPITDEERYQNLDVIPYGEICDVTLKKDGQSVSFYCKLDEDNGEPFVGICGRKLEYKREFSNNYTNIEKKHEVLGQLKDYCLENNISLCLRGEITGGGIQKMKINPDCGGELKLWLFSTWLFDERRYARKGEKYYIHSLASELTVPTVPMICSNIELNQDVIHRYDEELEILNGKNFEGVVIQTPTTSFKIVNKYYDSEK